MAAMSALPACTLPDTAALLVSGGDARLLLDPASGLSMYGCRPQPEPGLVALGSCTASQISAAGFAAAHALRRHCIEQLRCHSPGAVYAGQTARLRSELLACCGLAPSDGVDLVLGASGSDLFLLAAQWLRPHRTVLIAAGETGSGVPAALQGRHFNGRSGAVTLGAPVADWQGEILALAVRAADGSLRATAAVDADCVAGVAAAAAAGQRVLLVLTDVSKTGLIVPSVEVALALKRRFPTQVEVLVDACQFRLGAATVRAYLAQDCMVALTGSKFIGGPTFCGALLIPPACAARHSGAALGGAVGTYSNAADWPAAWRASHCLPATANFGLLLRWAAALAELRAFLAVPESDSAAFVRRFGASVRLRLAQDGRFEALPVAPLARPALGIAGSWDSEQTIFPFLVRGPGGRPFSADETQRLHRALRGAGRYQLGQPVACGIRDGVPVSALRVCVGARMLVAAHAGAGSAPALAGVCAAFDAIARLAEKIPQAIA